MNIPSDKAANLGHKQTGKNDLACILKFIHCTCPYNPQHA